MRVFSYKIRKYNRYCDYGFIFTDTNCSQSLTPSEFEMYYDAYNIIIDKIELIDATDLINNVVLNDCAIILESNKVFIDKEDDVGNRIQLKDVLMDTAKNYDSYLLVMV